MPFYFQRFWILSIFLPGIWDTWFNIFVTSRDIENLGKLIMGIFANYKGYLPVYFKGYGIFGTPIYKPHYGCLFLLVVYGDTCICALRSLAFFLVH